MPHLAANTSGARLDDPEFTARLRADAIAAYQPANSQELFAVERIVLAQFALLRVARLEAELFANLDHASEASAPAAPWPAFVQHSNAIALFLRYQAQSERLYRRAVEDFERLKDQREEFSDQPAMDAAGVLTINTRPSSVPARPSHSVPAPMPLTAAWMPPDNRASAAASNTA